MPLKIERDRSRLDAGHADHDLFTTDLFGFGQEVIVVLDETVAGDDTCFALSACAPPAEEGRVDAMFLKRLENALMPSDRNFASRFRELDDEWRAWRRRGELLRVNVFVRPAKQLRSLQRPVDHGLWAAHVHVRTKHLLVE